LAANAATAAITETAAQIRSQIQQLQQEEESSPTAQLQQEIQQLEEAQRQQALQASGQQSSGAVEPTSSGVAGVHLNTQA
jgi:hypothetical protein